MLLIEAGRCESSKEDNVYRNVEVGLTIRKPVKWVFLEKSESTNGTLVVIARHPEPYSGLNPACRIRIVSADQSATNNATHQADAQIAKMKASFRDFAVVDGPKEMSVAGLQGTYFEAKYSLPRKLDKPFWKMWFLPKGRFIFVLTVSGPQKDAELLKKEFTEILESIKIE
jgi:hypothetical protein